MQMVVGDLVVLSPFAKRSKCMEQYYLHRADDTAIIVSVGPWPMALTIVWSSDGKKQGNVDERDLDYAEIKK